MRTHKRETKTTTADLFKIILNSTYINSSDDMEFIYKQSNLNAFPTQYRVRRLAGPYPYPYPMLILMQYHNSQKCLIPFRTPGCMPLTMPSPYAMQPYYAMPKRYAYRCMYRH